MRFVSWATQPTPRVLSKAKEPAKLRDKYGRHDLGQCCLLARRLVEAGVTFVTVQAGGGWDTHGNNFKELKDKLLPKFDQALAALVTDLCDRGLQDDVLVMCTGEFGRTPKINPAKGGGRDHWSQAYSAVLAGGGTARGKVVGKTDKIGGTVADRPVSPKDVLATAYHLLGYDLETMLTDRANRPVPLVPNGQVVREVLG